MVSWTRCTKPKDYITCMNFLRFAMALLDWPHFRWSSDTRLPIIYTYSLLLSSATAHCHEVSSFDNQLIIIIASTNPTRSPKCNPPSILDACSVKLYKPSISTCFCLANIDIRWWNCQTAVLLFGKPIAGGVRNSREMLRSAAKARASHSSRARVVISISKDEAWPKEKMTGLGCQGLGFEYVRSLKRLTDAAGAGTVLAGI